MNEDAYLILDYLPCSYRFPREEEYVYFLWETFLANYEKEKYQFALIAYHMLFMSFVYFSIWKIKIERDKDFKKALIGFSKDIEKDMVNASSPFTFSKIKESKIFRFLKLVECSNEKIGEFTKIVRIRNDISHSNGNIFFNSCDIADEKINKILESVENIQRHTNSIIGNIFEQFLMNNWDDRIREFFDDEDQIREILIHQNYLSKKDVDYCLAFDVNNLNEKKNFSKIKKLFRTFKVKYLQN